MPARRSPYQRIAVAKHNPITLKNSVIVHFPSVSTPGIAQVSMPYLHALINLTYTHTVIYFSSQGWRGANEICKKLAKEGS